jgi:hypothetical protein
VGFGSSGPLSIRGGDPVDTLRPLGRQLDWVALRKLHRALLRIAPSLGAAVSLAVVDGEVDGAGGGLAHSRCDHRPGDRAVPAGLDGTRTSAGQSGPAQGGIGGLSQGHRAHHRRRCCAVSGPTTRRGRGLTARHAHTLAVVASPDAISGARGAMVFSISVTVRGGTPAAASASAKCPATRLKWTMVIPRPWWTCFIGAPV